MIDFIHAAIYKLYKERYPVAIVACSCAFQLKPRNLVKRLKWLRVIFIGGFECCVKRRIINFVELELEANRDCEIDNRRQIEHLFTLTVLILKARVNRLSFHK